VAPNTSNKKPPLQPPRHAQEEEDQSDNSNSEEEEEETLHNLQFASDFNNVTVEEDQRDAEVANYEEDESEPRSHPVITMESPISSRTSQLRREMDAVMKDLESPKQNGRSFPRKSTEEPPRQRPLVSRDEDLEEMFQQQSDSKYDIDQLERELDVLQQRMQHQAPIRKASSLPSSPIVRGYGSNYKSPSSSISKYKEIVLC
jgi:hypothetical protein